MARAITTRRSLGDFVRGFLLPNGEIGRVIPETKKLHIPILELTFPGELSTFVDSIGYTNIENEVHWRKGALGVIYLLSLKNKTNFMKLIQIKNFPAGQPYLRTSKDDLGNEYSRYKMIIEIAERVEKETDYKVVWNEFDSSLHSKKHIIFLNIDMPTCGSWRKFLREISKSSDLSTAYFIFYTLHTTEEELEQRLERTDRLRAESRFIRDFLQGHGHAIILRALDAGAVEAGVQEVSRLIKERIELKPLFIFKQGKALIKRILKGKNIYIPSIPQEIAVLFAARNVDPGISDMKLLEELNRKALGDALFKFVKPKASPHGILYEESKFLNQWDKSDANAKALGSIHFWHHFSEILAQVAGTFLEGKFPENLSILFIDDRPKSINKQISIISKHFPKWRICLVKKDEWKKFLGVNINSLLELRISSEVAKDLNEPQTIRIETYSQNKDQTPTGLRDFDLVVVDIEYDEEPKGLDILHRFRRTFGMYGNPYVITLSRREDATTIQEALNSGSLFYITKNSFFELLSNIYRLGPLLEKEKQNLADAQIKKRDYAQYQNWHLLSKLPLAKVLELQSTVISGDEYDIEKDRRWEDDYDLSTDYKWIRKLPKADIHCHIGSCLGPDLLPKTAIIVLSELYAKKYVNAEKKLRAIIDFLLPIVADPYLNESKPDLTNTVIGDETIKYKNDLGLKATKGKSIFEIISYGCQAQCIPKPPERLLLDPFELCLEKIRKNEKKSKSSLYFKRKNYLRKLRVDYDEVMLVFIILLYIRDERTNNGSIDTDLIYLCKEIAKLTTDIPIYHNGILSQLEYFRKIWNSSAVVINRVLAEFKPTGELIHFLQSAHSSKRCLKEKGASLFNYLRGCEYAGSAHLQTRASIYLGMKYIINEYALKDNIRYLCLRCAVDGYSKAGLQSTDEAMQAVLESADYFKKKALDQDKKIHINIIVTAKRHKRYKWRRAFEKNAEIALKYRDGISQNTENGGGLAYARNSSFFKTNAKVVSFDLAGLEEGYRPSKFKRQFYPLLKACLPITIHAGEEDDSDSIWEAVYEIHSQRLGHALTLRHDKDLLSIIRERHIAIELCPLSNLLTSGKFNFVTFNKEVQKKEKVVDLFDQDEIYPLRQYMNENLDVTINTDNPFVSDTTLTREFLVAAKLIGGLTKWEILRLIKNSFRSASINKKEKRLLMNEIDSEIYELLLKEDQR